MAQRAAQGKRIEDAIVAALGLTVKYMMEDIAEAYVAAALRARQVPSGWITIYLILRPDVDLERHTSRKRQWGLGDKKRLRKLKAKGWSDSQIGAAIDRTASAVGQQWNKMRHEGRARV